MLDPVGSPMAGPTGADIFALFDALRFVVREILGTRQSSDLPSSRHGLAPPTGSCQAGYHASLIISSKPRGIVRLLYSLIRSLLSS